MIRFGLVAVLACTFASALAGMGAFAQGLPTVYRGPTLPDPEFDAASAIRVLPNGDVVELAGSFLPTVPADLNAMISRQTMAAMTAALSRVREDVSQAPSTGIGSEERTRLIATLIGSLHVEIQSSAEGALRLTGAHESYCRSMIVMLNAALALPSEERGPTLRALLTDG
jgi:hypothetical protein